MEEFRPPAWYLSFGKAAKLSWLGVIIVKQGDLLTLVQIGDLAVLTQRVSLLPKRSEEFTAITEVDGVSLADLLHGLEQEREQVWRERYAHQSGQSA